VCHPAPPPPRPPSLTCPHVQHSSSWLKVLLQQLEAYGVHVGRADGLALTNGKRVVLHSTAQHMHTA
jgi:hypothetical protein